VAIALLNRSVTAEAMLRCIVEDSTLSATARSADRKGDAAIGAKAAIVSVYRDELLAAENQGRRAYEAMDRWVSRPADAPGDTPAAVLEGYARDLRQSRERLRVLLAEHGNRDDVVAALAESERYHRALGLSIKDKADPIEDT
jgi:hypothetical protein